MKRLALLLAAALAGGTPLAAQVQVTCRPEQTVEECSQRFQPTGGVPDTAAIDSTKAAEGVAGRLQAKSTGTDLSTFGPLSAIRDFLPRLAGSLLAPTSGSDPTSLGFKANLPLNDGVLMDWGLTAQLAAVANDAKPFEMLIDSVPASLRDDARTQIQDQLEPYDDVTLTLALNMENRTFGRGMRQHRETVRALASQILAPFNLRQSPEDRADFEFAQFRMRLDRMVIADSTTFAVVRKDSASQAACRIRRPGEAPGPPAVTGRQPDAGSMRFGCFTPAAQDSIENAIARVATAADRALSQAAEAIRTSGFNKLAQLMNNQPQIVVNGDFRSRRDLTGPDEWTGSARFELGFANMNGLRRFCGTSGVTAACLTRYMNNPAVASSLTRGDRVFVQADFTRRNAWHVALPADSVDLSLGAATTLSVSGGYGSYIGNPQDGENRDRLDVQAKYDFTSNDVIRQNRFLATLFYTRRLSDQSSAVIGLSYANRPEFLGAVDHHIRANLGLTYKLNQSKQDLAGSGTP